MAGTARAQFTYVTNEGGITITGYTGPGGTLAIPTAINGLAVTSIGDWAFAGSTPTNFSIPDSVGSIGDGAFSGCPNLENLSIGWGLTNLGDEAFFGCANLGNATIGGSLSFLGYEIFALCGSLTNVTIPASVSSIGENTFFGTALTSLVIPGNVTDIGAAAFWSCTNLKSIYFLGNGPNLDEDPFAGDNMTVYYAWGTLGWGPVFDGFPVVPLGLITLSATPTSGAGPINVNFTSADVDSTRVPIASWNWSFGDGSFSTNQNPSHTYASANTFYPELIATNNRGQTVFSARVPAITVAPPQPVMSSVSVSGGNLAINVSNGLAGGVYCALASDDPALPLSQWTPVATNVLSASGDFTMTVANAISPPVPSRFYVLQCHGPIPYSVNTTMPQPGIEPADNRKALPTRPVSQPRLPMILRSGKPHVRK